MERALARVKAMAEGGGGGGGGGGSADPSKVGAGAVGLPLAMVVPAVPKLAAAPEQMPACHVQYPWRGALYPVM